MFEFDMRIVAKDDTGYYYARWDRAQKLTVRGTTKQEAIDKACKLMGNTGRHGWSWAVKTDVIREVVE